MNISGVYVCYVLTAIYSLLENSKAIPIRSGGIRTHLTSDSARKLLSRSIKRSFLNSGLLDRNLATQLKTKKRAKRSIVSMVNTGDDDMIRNILTHTWDLQRFVNVAFDYYCETMQGSIPKETYKSCTKFATEFVNVKKLAIPKITTYTVLTAPTKTQDIELLMEEAHITLSKWRFVVAKLISIEEDSSCPFRIHRGLPCYTCTRGSENFWCHLNGMHQRLNALVTHLRLNLDKSKEGNGNLINLTLPKYSQSTNVVFNFAALYQLREQTSRTYDAFHLILNS